MRLCRAERSQSRCYESRGRQLWRRRLASVSLRKHYWLKRYQCAKHIEHMSWVGAKWTHQTSDKNTGDATCTINREVKQLLSIYFEDRYITSAGGELSRVHKFCDDAQ